MVDGGLFDAYNHCKIFCIKNSPVTRGVGCKYGFCLFGCVIGNGQSRVSSTANFCGQVCKRNQLDFTDILIHDNTKCHGIFFRRSFIFVAQSSNPMFIAEYGMILILQEPDDSISPSALSSVWKKFFRKTGKVEIIPI